MIRLFFRLLLLFIAVMAIGVLWQRAQLEVLALGRIDPVPVTRQLVAQERYAEAADYLGFFMAYPYVCSDPAAQDLMKKITEVRDSFDYQVRKLGEGLVSGSSDETVGQIAGVASDFLVIGDLRDLVTQGTRWAHNEETDEVIIALATIGVVATGAQLASGAATVFSAGAASPALAASTAVKGGTVILKSARKLGKLPPWLRRTLVREAKTVKRSGSLDSVKELFGNVYVLARTRDGMTLLSQTTDAASLAHMARFARIFGDQSGTVYRLGGASAVNAALHAGETGQNAVRLAATYGQRGLRTLDRVGAIRFVKYSARATKITWKGDLIRLVARFLSRLPDWMLYLLAAIGTGVWLPYRHLGIRRSRSDRNVSRALFHSSPGFRNRNTTI